MVGINETMLVKVNCIVKLKTTLLVYFVWWGGIFKSWIAQPTENNTMEINRNTTEVCLAKLVNIVLRLGKKVKLQDNITWQKCMTGWQCWNGERCIYAWQIWAQFKSKEKGTDAGISSWFAIMQKFKTPLLYHWWVQKQSTDNNPSTTQHGEYDRPLVKKYLATGWFAQPSGERSFPNWTKRGILKKPFWYLKKKKTEGLKMNVVAGLEVDLMPLWNKHL